VVAGFCLLTLPAFAQSPTLDIEYAEHAVLSIESLLMDIVALPGGGFVAVGERGHVVISSDGKSWQQAEVVPTRSTLTTIAESGGRLWAAGHDSVILTSGDGGLNWTQQFFGPDRQQPIMDVHFFDPSNGMAIGAYGLTLVTSDGGASWQEHMINAEEWHNNAILVLNESDMLVAGEAGFSYRSADRGLSWETIEMPYPGSMFGILKVQQECVLVFGLRGHTQQSCDFGESWAELETGTESSITDAVFIDGKTILVGNSGLILIADGDGNFTASYHSSGVDFAAIVEAGDGRFLLAGEDGIHHYPESAQ